MGTFLEVLRAMVQGIELHRKNSCEHGGGGCMVGLDDLCSLFQP